MDAQADESREAGRDGEIGHVEIQMTLVSDFGPPLGMDPDMLDIQKRSFHSIYSCRHAQDLGYERALKVVPDPEFGNDCRNEVIDRFLESVEDAPDRLPEVLGDFFKAGLMHEWVDRLRSEVAWTEMPLAVLCGHVLTEPIRAALDDAERNYLPRAAVHLAFVDSTSDAARLKSQLQEAVEENAVSVCPDRTEVVRLEDVLGRMSLHETDEQEIDETGFALPGQIGEM